MKEIAALPWNGRSVVSTFSGGGGSCLGYRMAGCRVLWASEFVPAAQEVYKLNHPDSFLSKKDIRKVTAAEILKQAGLEKGELDILDGSPPCAGFSTTGKIEKGWGKVKRYSDTKQVVDDLFFEYARLVEGLQPKVFVAENVPGLITGKSKGYFKMILRDLKRRGYRVKAKVLAANRLGVPQSRKRLIFVGVREDLNFAPPYPKPLPYRYVMSDAIFDPDVSGLMIGKPTELHAPWPGRGGHVFRLHEPVPTIQAGLATVGGAIHRLPLRNPVLYRDPETKEIISIGEKNYRIADKPTRYRRFDLIELRRVCGFPADFKLTGNYTKRWERLGRAVPPVMMSHIAGAAVAALAKRGV